jgi:hypothetical protein
LDRAAVLEKSLFAVTNFARAFCSVSFFFNVGQEFMGVPEDLERIPIRRVPVLQPHDLGQFRAIAKGAVLTSDETCAHGFHEDEPRLFGVLVYDETMTADGIEKGCVVLVNPDVQYEMNATVAVIAPGHGRILIRRYRGIQTDPEGGQHISFAAFQRRLASIESYRYGADGAQIVGPIRWVSRAV